MTQPLNHAEEYRALYLRQLHATRTAELVARVNQENPRVHETRHIRTRMIAASQHFPRLATVDGQRVAFGRAHVAA